MCPRTLKHKRGNHKSPNYQSFGEECRINFVEGLMMSKVDEWNWSNEQDDDVDVDDDEE